MKKIWKIMLCLSFFALVGCSSQKEDGVLDDEDFVQVDDKPKEELKDLIQFQESYPDDQPVAIMDTDYGTITIVLFPEVAPKAVENFTTHAKDGYYDGLTFHRVISDFMIQGGDPNGDGSGGESIWGEGFKVEISNKLYHFRGALSMARAQSLSSQGSQFFIVQSNQKDAGNNTEQIVKDKYAEVGGSSSLDGAYTVFGQTLEGMDVVDKIATVEKGANDKPVSDVNIKTIKITTYGEYKNK